MLDNGDQRVGGTCRDRKCIFTLWGQEAKYLVCVLVNEGGNWARELEFGIWGTYSGGKRQSSQKRGKGG